MRVGWTVAGPVLGLWLLVCVLAGALAGVGLIEFNWAGPPYDGGFLGHLVLFGGFLSAGQLPFVVFFLCRNLAVGAGRSLTRLLVGVSALWVFLGFAGWILGSIVKVALPIAYSPFEPSFLLWVFWTGLPWFCVGVVQALLVALALTRRWRIVGDGAGGYRASRVVLVGVLWSLACAVGGALVETWMYFQITAAVDGSLLLTVGGYLREAGVAENVAEFVLAYAFSVPVLYGIPTGLILAALFAARTRRQAFVSNT